MYTNTGSYTNIEQTKHRYKATIFQALRTEPDVEAQLTLTANTHHIITIIFYTILSYYIIYDYNSYYYIILCYIVYYIILYYIIVYYITSRRS